MIVETALRIAGAGSHLVRRGNRPVVHVYVGPLTPSGRYVPRSSRTVCRAHTRRLVVLPTERRSSLDPTRSWRLCARCSARLSRSVLEISSSRRAEPTLTTRGDYLAAFAGTRPVDLAFALAAADTPAEVDAVAHLSLLLFGHAVCTRPVLWPDGSTRPSLHDQINRTRGRYTPRSAADRAFDELVSSGYAQLKAESIERHHEREARIARFGINHVQPEPRKRATR